MKAEWTNSDSLTTSQTTKAILVVDMPTDCIKCPLADGYCWNTFPTKGKADGCPLKPMPENKPTTIGRQNTKSTIAVAEEIFNNGYNACLDEIMGETE